MSYRFIPENLIEIKESLKKIKEIAVFDTSKNQYVKIIGYFLSIELEYANDKLTKIKANFLTEEGTITIYKEIIYDATGKIIGISEWKI